MKKLLKTRMGGRSECNRSLAYAAVNLDCPQSIICIDVKGIVCVCSLTCVLPWWPAAVAAERLGDHISTLLLPHNQLPSISPTGALYDVCQLITSDSI